MLKGRLTQLQPRSSVGKGPVHRAKTCEWQTARHYLNKNRNPAMLQKHFFLLLFSLWETNTHHNYSLCLKSAALSVPICCFLHKTFIQSCLLPSLPPVVFLHFITLLFLSGFSTSMHTQTPPPLFLHANTHTHTRFLCQFDTLRCLLASPLQAL